MHEALTGLREWQAKQEEIAEAERLRAVYAARDLEVFRRRRQQQADYEAAYHAAVLAGEEPPEPPPEPRPEPNRAAELSQVTMALLEEQRALTRRLVPQVVKRAQGREAELLAKALDTKVADLEPIRAELEDLATTLRQVCADGPEHRHDVDVADVVIAATEGGSCLWLPVDRPGVTVHTEPTARIQVDRAPSPTNGEVREAAANRFGVQVLAERSGR